MDDVLRHNDRYNESQRLFEALGPLELARSQEVCLPRSRRSSLWV